VILKPLFLILITMAMIGTVYYAPAGVTRYIGGRRPGNNLTIGNFSATNTLIMVRFVCYIHQSSPEFNADETSYTYGTFTIIGRGDQEGLMKFVEVDVKGADGKKKDLTVQTDTAIQWTARTAGVRVFTFRIEINQEIGSINIVSTEPTLSYMFEIFGGL